MLELNVLAVPERPILLQEHVYLMPYGDPRGVGVSDEWGTPAGNASLPSYTKSERSATMLGDAMRFY